MVQKLLVIVYLKFCLLFQHNFGVESNGKLESENFSLMNNSFNAQQF